MLGGVAARRHPPQPGQLPDCSRPTSWRATGCRTCSRSPAGAGSSRIGEHDERLDPRGPGDRGALRAHVPGPARGLPAHRPARRVHLLRGVHPHRRLDVQPARQVARGERAGPVAATDRQPQLPAVVARVAPGPQRLHPPGPGLPRRGDEQEARDRARLPAARRQHAAVARTTTACARGTTSTWSSPGKQPQADWLSAEDGRAALRPRRRHLGVGRHRATAGVDPDVVLACAGDVPTLETLAAASILRDAPPGPAGAGRQRRRPDAAAARRPSTRTGCPTASSTTSSPTTGR